MPLVTLNLNPDAKLLRQFGIIALCAFSAAGLLLTRTAGLPAGGAVALCTAGAALFILSRISPRLVRPVYVGLILLSFPIGWVVGHTLMALFFYLVISGTGLIFRLARRDVLRLNDDPNAETYWIPRTRRRPPEDYFRQF